MKDKINLPFHITDGVEITLQDKITVKRKELNELQKEISKIRAEKIKAIKKFVGKKVVITYRNDNPKSKGRIRGIINKVTFVNGTNWECVLDPDFKILGGGPKPIPLFAKAIKRITEI